MDSCLYEGVVRHRRFEPVRHEFRYRVALALIDLAELPALLSPNGGLAATRLAPRSFLRGDHLGPADKPLAEVIRERLAVLAGPLGRAHDGPIRLLTAWRSYGFYFSPLNVYYCYAPNGEFEAAVFEVSNTPWLEKHAYVFGDANRTSLSDARRLTYSTPKDFHVSPFMSMEMRYAVSITRPGRTLSIRMENRTASAASADDRVVFDVNLALAQRSWTRSALRRLAWRYPVAPLQSTAAIYFQALKLWMKRCPFYPHPKHVNLAPTQTQVPLQ